MAPDELPDPQGEPQPEKNPLVSNGFLLSLAAVVAAGVVVGPAAMGRSCARGASRSSRVKWAERQDEIDRTLSTQNNQPNPADGTNR